MSLIDWIAKITDEELASHVERAKSEVVAKAQETTAFDSEALLNATYRVAEAEVRSAVYRRVRDIVNDDAATQAEKRESLMSFIVSTLAQGADDSWSGRGNDFKRVKHDVLLTTLRRIIDQIKYGSEWKVGA